MLNARYALAVVLALDVAHAADLSVTNGFKVGDGRLHPYFDFETRYDSAAGYFGGTGFGGEVLFNFRPGLKFEVPGNNNALTFDGNAEYVLYSGLLSPSTGASHVEADVALDAALNKAGAIEFQVGDELTRSSGTDTPIFGVGLIALRNIARVAVPIHPGGGALEFTPRASWTVEFFQPLLTGVSGGCSTGEPSCDPAAMYLANYSNIAPGLGARWRFLPKTAVVFDSTVDLRSYWNVSAVNRAATLWKTQVGLSGLITDRLTLTAMVGWGYDFQGSGANTVLGQAEVGFVPVEAVRLGAGYVRGLAPVPQFGVVGSDRGYVNSNIQLAGRVNLKLSVAADYLSFYASAARNDFVFSGEVAPTVRVLSWFEIGLSYQATYRQSTATAISGLSYLRHQGMLRLAAYY